MSGPTTEAIAYAEPSTPVKAGRNETGAETPMMMKEPAKEPATPTPVMTRPAIKVMLFWATPNSGHLSDMLIAEKTACSVSLTAY